MTRTLPRSRRLILPVLVLALVAAGCGSSGKSHSSKPSAPKLAAATLNSSGATFPQAFYQEAIKNFAGEQPAVTINYGGGGSGKGQTDLQGQLVDFAGSDALPKPEDLAKYKGGALLYFPTVAAPITLSYNLSGVGNLQLSAATIAKVFAGQITKWDDPAIKAENSGASLPSTAITTVHRSDASGTTANFTKYLVAAAGSAWTLGSDKSVNWPGGQAGNGNGGVAQIVKSTPGTIGYVDFSDAKAAGLSFAAIKNASGQYVEPSTESASQALAGSTVNSDLSYNPLNAPGAKAYPITAPTWILVYKNQTGKAKGEALKAFLEYVLAGGQTAAASVDFAKLPDSLQQRAKAQLSQIVIP